MRNLHPTLLGISTSILLSSFSIEAYAQSSIGVNAAVKGDVTITSPDQKAKQALVKDPVYLGQMINSKKLSSLQVMLKDETIFTLGADCELVIDKFVYDPDKNNNSLSASVSKGMFRFMSGNISKSSSKAISIDTPVASMGIRGTMVEGLIGPEAVAIAVSEGILPVGITVDSAGATLFVLRGPGPKNIGNNKKGEITVTSGGQTVIVSGTNKAVFIPSAGAAPIVFSLSTQAFENFSQSLRTTPTSLNTYKHFEIDKHFDAKVSSSQSPSNSNASNAGQSQTGTSAGGSTGSGGAAGAGTAGAGAGASTVVFGLGALGALGALGTIGVVVAASGDDDPPSSP